MEGRKETAGVDDIKELCPVFFFFFSKETVSGEWSLGEKRRGQ